MLEKNLNTDKLDEITDPRNEPATVKNFFTLLIYF